MLNGLKTVVIMDKKKLTSQQSGYVDVFYKCMWLPVSVA